MKNFSGFSIFYKRHAFSLVEMLMALLVASLLLAALAPVMTKRMNENVTLTGNMNPAGTVQKTHEIEYGSEDCSDIKINTDGSTYCEGEYVVPTSFNGYIKVTAIGAGGGGGTAPTAGYTEYTTAGSTGTFTVPAMVESIEATLVSGGNGGAPGASNTVTKNFTAVGSNTFTIPDVLKNRNAIVNMCGGGGYGGASAGDKCWGSDYYPQGAGGGGSGGFYANKAVTFPNITSTEVYVGKAATGSGGWLSRDVSLFCSLSTSEAAANRNGTNAGDATGGAGGVASNQHVFGGHGGKGGSVEGGNGAPSFGWCGNVGGGGHGGWASRLGTAGQSHYLITGGGGGGGGAGVWITSCYGTANVCTSGGAGGGGGGTGVGGKGGYSYSRDKGCSSEGGGGGLPGGNAGGTGNCSWTAKTPGSSGKGGDSPLPGFSGYCYGGHGSGYSVTRPPANGIVSIKYLDFTTGGSGGNGGKVLQNTIGKVTEKTEYSVAVGSGGGGGTAAYISNSGSIVAAAAAGAGTASRIYTGSTNVLTSDNGVLKGTAATAYTGYVGGTGGAADTPFTACVMGSGSTSRDEAGKNASGYGCGGGGGYSLGNGGKGSGGYARIAWNKYWDTALNVYKLSGTGAGGGGASGNIMTYSMEVKAGQTIKFRIGKGGSGAYVLNNSIVEAKKGGDTIFGKVQAGGGFGSGRVQYDTVAGALKNADGGNFSTICHYDGTSYLNKKNCTKGNPGQTSTGNTGGLGANFAGYSYTVTTKDGTEEKKDITGTGGNGGQQDTGDGANGKNSTGIASGGGGAAIRDLGRVDPSSQSNILNNPTKGGDGGNGKIILEWWQ